MIQFIKLTNGETILADVLETTDSLVTVLNPIEISIKNVSNYSKASMIGYQWLPLLEDENIIDVQLSQVVAIADTSIQVKEFYVDVVDQYLNPENSATSEEDAYAEILKQIQESANTASVQVH